MCDPNLLQKIEQYVEEINKLKETFSPLPTDWELVLELGHDDETGEPICSYYFVRHSTRCLFWLHEFDLESVVAGLCGVTEITHIRESIPVPDTHRINRVTRPGVAIPVLVGDDRMITTDFWLTILGLTGRHFRITGRSLMSSSKNSVGFYFMRASVRQVQNVMSCNSRVAQTV